ncbi:MAG: Flp family type IVb pilin [Caulobacteraceae bacterium]
MRPGRAWRDERGATGAEYALILAIVAGMIVVSLSFIGGQFNGVFARLGHATQAAMHNQTNLR